MLINLQSPLQSVCLVDVTIEFTEGHEILCTFPSSVMIILKHVQLCDEWLVKKEDYMKCYFCKVSLS